MLSRISGIVLDKVTHLQSQHLLVSIVIICLVGLIYHVLYNIFFHPLKRFPGPFWGRLSDFYKTYLFSTRQFHLRALSLHQKFGPFVRLAPNLISISDPFLLPDIYHKHAEKTPFYSTGIAGEVAPLLQLQNDRDHATKVKMLAPTFSMKNLQLMEDIIDERVVRTLDTLRVRYACTEKETDLADWIRYYVYDTITHLIYGKAAGMVEAGHDVENLIKSWHDMFRLGGLVATLPWLIHPLINAYPFNKYLMPRKGHRSGSGHIMSIHENFFNHRLKHPDLAHIGNILDKFRDTKYPDGTALSTEDAKRECYLSTVAGQDTTAALISSLIYRIVSTPTIYLKLMSEIDTFEEQSKLSMPVALYEEIESMLYFKACVREALRIDPPTPIILPRYESRGGMTINGIWVPEGTELAANPHIIHRSEKVFGDDVEMFRPERWLQQPEQVRLMDKYDFAWGYGSRRCIGKNIALLEAHKFCVQLFRDFHVSLPRPTESLNWGIIVYHNQFVKLKIRSSKKAKA